MRVIISVGEFGQDRRLNGETRAGIAGRGGEGQTTRLQSGVLPQTGHVQPPGVTQSRSPCLAGGPSGVIRGCCAADVRDLGEVEKGRDP